MTKQRNTVSLKEFSKDFTVDQKRIVEETKQQYYIVTTLYQARKKKSMSQAQLAAKAQMNRTTLSQIETGLRNATVASLEKIAHALGMKLEIRFRVS